MPLGSRCHESTLVCSGIFSLLISCWVMIGSAPQPVSAAVRAPTASIVSELRANTQALLDALALGEVRVWNHLLDPGAIQIDENNVVRRKAAILAEVKPLEPGIDAHLKVDDFFTVVSGDVAVVTYEDAETVHYHGQLLLDRFRITDIWHRTAHGWRLLSSQELAVQNDPPSMTLESATLCSYAGTYALTKDILITLQCSGDHLIDARTGRPDRVWRAEIKDIFFERGQPRIRRIFLRDKDGLVTGFVDRREERHIAWTRIP